MSIDEELQIFCQKIYTLRVQNQLSQQEMAQKLRISLSALQKIEQGFPPLQMRCGMLLKIQKEFGIKPKDLFMP